MDGLIRSSFLYLVLIEQWKFTKCFPVVLLVLRRILNWPFYLSFHKILLSFEFALTFWFVFLRFQTFAHILSIKLNFLDLCIWLECTWVKIIGWFIGLDFHCPYLVFCSVIARCPMTAESSKLKRVQAKL